MHINVPSFIFLESEFWLFEGRQKHISPEELQSILRLLQRNIWLVFLVVIFDLSCFFIEILPHNLSGLLFLLALLPLNNGEFFFLHGALFFDEIKNTFGFFLDHGCEVEDSVLGDRLLFVVIFDCKHFTDYCFFEYLDWF